MTLGCRFLATRQGASGAAGLGWREGDAGLSVSRHVAMEVAGRGRCRLPRSSWREGDARLSVSRHSAGIGGPQVAGVDPPRHRPNVVTPALRLRRSAERTDGRERGGPEDAPEGKRGGGRSVDAPWPARAPAAPAARSGPTHVGAGASWQQLDRQHAEGRRVGQVDGLEQGGDLGLGEDGQRGAVPLRRAAGEVLEQDAELLPRPSRRGGGRPRARWPAGCCAWRRRRPGRPGRRRRTTSGSSAAGAA